MGSSNETSFFGPVGNPWNDNLVPGGSSGGSAACVAANITSISTGTDTGGSIRQPAALCGITGMKPTYGLVSRWGMIAFCSSMDQAGPFARDAFGCAALLDAMASYDAKDSTCSKRDVVNFENALAKDFGALNIGIIKNIEDLGINNDVLEAYEHSKSVLQQLGHTLKEIDFSELSSGICSYYVIAPAECSSNLSRFDGVKYGYRSDQNNISELYMKTRAEGFGDEVKKRILIGTHVLSAGFYDAYYLKAQQVRRMMKNKFEDIFKDVDLIFMPTTLDQAFEKNRQDSDPNRMYKEDLLTIPANLAGLPAISFPNGFKNNLPIGGQFVGNYFKEDLLLNTANKIQEVTDWHKMTP
jgi:aspartyl-tRNA(Asn)/glutamyl-tRNA(Gln) amidotransferase subunit A